MIAYVDSSVFLRVLLNQKGKLAQFAEITRPIASKLLKTECLRTLDRLRVQGLLTSEQYLVAAEELYDSVDSIELIDMSDAVLERAGGSFAVALGTLDAIHLSSALKWREVNQVSPMFLTHDSILGMAARSLQFETVG